MSTVIAPPGNEAAGRRAGEARLVVPDVSRRVYETWEDSLPESTPVRMAYDGRDLEIMTKGPDHEDYRQLLGHLVVEIARSLKRPLKGLGETTWKRSEIQRGIEADQCYYFSPEKLTAAARSRGANDVASFPNPDLAIEVDLSPSLIDRARHLRRDGRGRGLAVRWRDPDDRAVGPGRPIRAGRGQYLPGCPARRGRAVAGRRGHERRDRLAGAALCLAQERMEEAVMNEGPARGIWVPRDKSPAFRSS